MVDRLTFQARNESLSMIVDCAISCPGNTPQVTAFLPPSGTFVRSSPYHKKVLYPVRMNGVEYI